MSQEHSNMTTPLYKAKGHGAAHEGTHHWWMQRVTSVALIPLSIFVLINLKNIITTDISNLTNFLANPPVTIAMISFILITYYHAYMGLQVVIEDYVHCRCAKPLLLIFNQIFFFILAVAAVYAIAATGIVAAQFAVQIEG